MAGPTNRRKNPLINFCRRFTSTIAMFVSVGLLCLTLIYTSGSVTTFFFSDWDLATTMQYGFIYSSVLLFFTSLLSLSSVPSSNLSVMTTVTLSLNAAVLIHKLATYVTTYDVSKPDFQLDGFLVAWLTAAFLSTLLSILESILSLDAHVKLVRLHAAHIAECSHVTMNPSAVRGVGSVQRLDSADNYNNTLMSRDAALRFNTLTRSGTIGRQYAPPAYAGDHADYTTFM